jgi:hypothetical protein
MHNPHTMGSHVLVKLQAAMKHVFQSICDGDDKDGDDGTLMFHTVAVTHVTHLFDIVA